MAGLTPSERVAMMWQLARRSSEDQIQFLTVSRSAHRIMRTATRLFLLLAAAIAVLPAIGTAQAKRPNILHIHADDHRPDGLRALGTPLLQTPNLDQLVESGMTFTRAYTMGSMVGAVCTPSRTMMLTGRSWRRIPGQPGASANAADPETFLPRIIAAAGYQTWHMGQYGNGFRAGLKAFETTIGDEGRGKTANDDRAHNSQRLADRTIEFLKARHTGHESQPFYIYLAPPVPHDPRDAESQFHRLYDPAKVSLSPSFLPQHPFDNVFRLSSPGPAYPRGGVRRWFT